MPSRSPEAEFATEAGRRATPARMNQFSDYLDGRLRAVEARRASFDAAIAELKGIGLERVTAVLQPLLDQASDDAAAISTLLADLSAPEFRASLIADTIAEIIAQGLFVRAGAGAEGMTLYSGNALPDPLLGQPGDLYAYVDPD